MVSTMTRCGHLFANARFMSRFLAALRTIADRSKCTRVPALPPHAREWRREAERILEKTMPARGLTPDGIDFALKVLNTSWDKGVDEELHHLCSPDCVCGGDHKTAVYTALLLLFGRGSPECLMYRWKGFEAAVCYVFRGLRCCAVLRRAFHLMYKQEDINNAERDVAAAGAAPDGRPNFAQQQTVRAGKCMKHFDADPKGHLCNEAILLNQPQQIYLNKCFKSESLSRAVIAAAASTPASPTPAAQREQFDKLVREAKQLNMKILGGDEATRVNVSLSTLLFHIRGAAWDELAADATCTAEDRFTSAKRLLCAATHSWWRLDFKHVQLPKVRLITILAKMPVYNWERLREELAPLRAKRQACQRCVDTTFTGRMLDLLDGPRSQQTFHACRALVPIMPLCSCIIERKHPLGQEIHAGKRRGRCPAATTFALRTYRKAALLELQRKEEVARKASLAGFAQCPKAAASAFTRALKAYASGVRADRRARSDVRRVQPLRSRSASAWNVFKKANWDQTVKVCRGDERERWQAEMRRVKNLYKGLGVAQKSVYEARAKAQANKRRDIGAARARGDTRSVKSASRRKE